MKNYPCDLLLKKFSTSVYLMEIDIDKKEVREMKFIHHTPYSKYSTSFLENPKNLMRLIPSEDWSVVKEALERLKYQDYVDFVIKFKTKDGRFIFLNPHFSVIDRDGNIVTVVGYNEEVSKREELRNITKTLFSFKDIGILIYQDKIIFSNEYVKKHFGLKEGDNLFELLSYSEQLISLMKRRLSGENFNMYHPCLELKLNKNRYFVDIFANTIIFKGKYSGFVIMLDKTLEIKKDKFLKILNHVYSIHVDCKNIDSFLNSVVYFVRSEGYNIYLRYKDKVYGEKLNYENRFEVKDKDFEFCISSNYLNDFDGLEDILNEFYFVVKHSIYTIENHKHLILLKHSFDESFQAVVITDEKLNVLYTNKIFDNLVKGRVNNLYELFENIEIDDGLSEKVLIGINKEGRRIFLKTKIIPIEYDKKYFVFQGILLSDKDTIVDSLTNLLNRKGFLQKNAMTNRKALIVLDIYEFKSIVESKGRKYAENILKELALFLQHEISYVNLGRVGGDEFAFLIDLDKLNKPLEEFLEDLIKKITKKLNLSVNIGVAIGNENFNNLEILLEKAYIALHHAITKGVNTFEIYNELIANKKKRFYSVQNLIKKAIENKLFIFHFHPYVDSNDFSIKGVESLIRIKDGDKIIYPNEFIEIAEESGLISEIEEITFPMAIDYAKKLSVNLSYNLSAYSFEKEKFYQQLPIVDNFIIEITERVLKDMDLAKKRIGQIKENNISVSIDDFGTGYSNFLSLKELDFDILKIDMSFVKNIQNSKKDRAIVKSIIDFAKTVGLITIAEGVESKEQVEILRDLGCDYLQGFYFYKPMSFDELKKIIGG